MKACLFFFLLTFWGSVATASLLDDDPDVVYLRQLDQKLKLKVENPRFSVFATKKGGRSRGQLREGSTAEIIGFTDRALQIRGTRADGQGMAGWVSPKAFKLPSPDFEAQMKEIHERELKVRKYIANGEVVLGMRPDEVAQVLGEPTKTSAKRTRDGDTLTWEFVEYDLVNHYATFIDPFTRIPYRRLTHTTQEVKERTAVTFTNGAATSIEESEEQSPRRPRIVVRPFIFPW